MNAIYMIVEGRLGNILWQVAAAATLAERLKVPYYVVPNSQYMCTEPDNCSLAEYIAPLRKTILRNVPFAEKRPMEACYLNAPDLTLIQQMPDTNLLLQGYFQNYRMIDEQIVRRLFAPDEATITRLQTTYPILRKSCTCSIVVRRGDYLLHSPVHFPVLDMAYYRKCMYKLEKTLKRNDVEYLIISDDPEWCKRNFVGERYTIVEDEPPLIDLYLSSLCSHNILSNSSFACWGGVLNANQSKEIYYPVPYLGIGMRKVDKRRKAMPPMWHHVLHFSEAYRKGVWMWLISGIQKRWNKMFGQ